ncbi:MAG: DNA replication complex GINS family protein [Candidatus Nitrosopelagicus sp.]|nr:DNA replication complex GINS family protein [Candidatus Nitrosopelagicus sp.]
MEIEDVVKVHSIGYGLEDVKVEFKHDLKMDVSGVQIEGKENEMMNIPRWVANILESEKHIIVHEQDMIKELKQAKVKEDVQDEDSLATLDKHFYIKLNAYMKKLETADFDKVESMLNQLVRIRRGKIVRLADSSKLTSNLSSKLSVEEEVYYNQIHNASLAFKKQILGEKK